MKAITILTETSIITTTAILLQDLVLHTRVHYITLYLLSYFSDEPVSDLMMNWMLFHFNISKNCNHNQSCIALFTLLTNTIQQYHPGHHNRKSSFGDVMEQFRNATKSLGRDASRKKNHHGIFSQHHEESSDYESEDNNDNYNEYLGKSKAAKSKSSVSLLKDFLHFSSSHSLSKSSKSKHGT